MVITNFDITVPVSANSITWKPFVSLLILKLPCSRCNLADGDSVPIPTLPSPARSTDKTALSPPAVAPICSFPLPLDAPIWVKCTLVALSPSSKNLKPL